MNITNYIKHFKIITKHKYYVYKACKLCGITWRGITHDLSKYSPREFLSSAKYFQGDRSPIDAEKVKIGYSLAWLHHKGRNRHHWQYWIDFTTEGKPYAIKMPYKDVVELVCDWIGAGKAYMNKEWTNKSPLDYWNKTKDKILLHEDTYRFLDLVFNKIAKLDWEVVAFLLETKSIKY